jgi:hypothetical protein
MVSKSGISDDDDGGDRKMEAWSFVRQDCVLLLIILRDGVTTGETLFVEDGVLKDAVAGSVESVLLTRTTSMASIESK